MDTLEALGCFGVIVGKALYRGEFPLEGIARYMLAKRIIPCLDIKDGRTVKRCKFRAVARCWRPCRVGARYSEEGADELVFLDITATHEKRKTLAALARNIAQHLRIPFTIGGGIAAVDDVGVLLDAGADKVAINSAAVRNPELISSLADSFGSQFVVLAVDAKQVDGEWWVHLNGGRLATDIRLFDWVKEAENRGAGEILFTSMNHDGTKTGFAGQATRQLSELVSIPVIASGGAGAISHFEEVFTDGQADAGLAASIFHFGEIPIPELKKQLRSKGIPVRS
ncbi:MAG: imidazole glycerol phosphate synthase subunit HisF [Saprospiraceae bacterium]